jgi:hypothetical protein
VSSVVLGKFATGWAVLILSYEVNHKRMWELGFYCERKGIFNFE